MRIGFDAKRAFFNQSGLGNYSRNILSALFEHYPENYYTLFTPMASSGEIFSSHPAEIVFPEGLLKAFPSAWRSFSLSSSINKNQCDVYHGLSNELPFDSGKANCKKVVTIHDLIFLRYPDLYPFIDRKIYFKKFRIACKMADQVIAISKQTKEDIINFFNVPEQKIKVIYQNCNPAFYKHFEIEEANRIKNLFKLPSDYLLYVGTIEERKDLLTLVKSLPLIKNAPKISLVIVGKKKKYARLVEEYAAEKGISNRLIFLSSVENSHLPLIYRNAKALIFPSHFEGFGIPILEALVSKTPVIAANTSSLTEAGGPDSLYFEKQNHEQLAQVIDQLLSTQSLQKEITEKGFEYAKKFSSRAIASDLMSLYQSLS
jgi:glycosyltransferase involved in cell wall biosynthesis